VGKRSEEELEKKLILLYKGDWIRLQEILGRRITPTEFIRRVVRRTINRAYEKRNQVARSTEDVSLE
jgi:hypothetical protein